MKTKDLLYLVLAVVILLVSGYVGYTQLVPKKAGASSVTQVEVVGAIPGQLDQGGLSWLGDAAKVQDYNMPIDLSGLNNSAPFGP